MESYLIIQPEKRLIDLTYGEIVQCLRQEILNGRETLKQVEEKPNAETIIHPETGLPESPEDEVGKIRACEILRSVNDPLGKATLDKYRKQPRFLPSGLNIGGFGLPYTIIGGKCSYKVKDLLAIRQNRHHFMK